MKRVEKVKKNIIKKERNENENEFRIFNALLCDFSKRDEGDLKLITHQPT